MKKILIATALVLCGPAWADTINWGSSFGTQNLQSDATTPVSGSFTIQLGKFSTGFDPDGANVDLWAGNWVPLDSLEPGTHNPAMGYFTSEVQLTNNNVFAAGDRAYVWMFNSQAAVPGSEWLLYTNDATDGNTGDDWSFPAVTGSQQSMGWSWRVSNASRVLFGGLDPDGPGSVPRRTGDGNGTPSGPPSYLQTYTFVPEPSAALLGLAGAALLLRRHRASRCTRNHAATLAALTVTLLAGMAKEAGAAPFNYPATFSLSISDNDNTTGTVRYFSVNDSFLINDLNVGLNVSHATRGQLRVTLTSPLGTTVQLINQGSDTDENYDITLDSAAAGALDNNGADNVASPYYTRAVAPSNSLNAFNGENASGVWALTLYDMALGTSGTLNRAELIFDGTGVVMTVRVFRDLYWDGIYQPDVDTGVSGMTVRGFDAGGNTAVLTPYAGGIYHLHTGTGLTGTRLRYEVDASTLPPGYFPGIIQTGPGANAAPLAGTVTTTPGYPTVNVPVQIPKTACTTAADLDLFTTCFIGGPRTNRTEVLTFGNETAPFVPADAPAVVAFPRSAAGTAPSTQNRYLATIEQVGTSYGLAPQAVHNRLYAGAFGKRHADVGPGGNGAIYVLDTGGGGILDTFTIPNAGNTAHGIDATNAANNGTPEGWIRDSLWYDRVGKEALGDVEINAAGTRLWTINLNDKHLYMVDVEDPTSPSCGKVTDLGAITATAECVGGEVNWRPFALHWNGNNLYVGGTCTGESTNNINHVSVLVYRLNSPTLNSGKTLIYDSRLSTADGGFKYNRGDSLIAWNPWRTTWDSAVFKSRSGFATIYPQPWLVDIAFDNNNRLILGIRDRFGDQIGIYTKNPGLGGTGDAASDNAFYETVTMGEVLMAEWNPLSGALGVPGGTLGDWRSELSPGFSLPRQDDPNDGVTSSEFFWRTSYTDIHPETAQGAAACHPLVPNEVTVVSQDPFSLRSGGVHFFSTANGSSPFQNGDAAGGYRVYQGQPQQGQLGLFGKANGLGDLEYGCATTVQQIGNLVWYDEDRDGVRDPNEVPVAGVVVRLYVDFDGNGLMDDFTGDGLPDALMQTTTGAAGTWLFQTRDSTACRITFDTSGVAPFNDSLNNPVLPANLEPARFQSVLNGGNSANDSDLSGQFAGLPVIPLFSGGIGESNHNLDAGFQSCAALTVTSNPGPLTPALAGSPYTASFSATGGTGPYTFAVTSGMLPPGLTLSSAGVLSGVPAAPGTVTFTVTASDATECTGTLVVTLTVEAPAHIGNRVWLDENSDGRQDAGEPGIPNVIVLLCDAAGVTELDSTVTDAWGGYRFDTAPGSYRVKVQGSSLPGGYTQTTIFPAPGADYVNQTQNGGTGYALTAASDGENLTADFGFNANPDSDVNNGAGTASLGNRVWVDADCDGFQDPNEPGLPGVGVKLCLAGPDGLFHTPDDATVDTAYTDAAGRYLFDGLQPGIYALVIHNQPLLAGYVQTGDPDSWGGSAGPNDAELSPVILGPGDVFLNADFGYCPPPAQNNSVGDRVWLDANADGVQDAGEYGIPGVTAVLIRDTNGDGQLDPNEPVVATTVTAADGLYGFSGVPDGDYLVWVNDADSVLGTLTQTFDSDGLATASLSGVDLDSASVSAVPVTNPDQDFGYTPPGHSNGEGLLGNTVWLDRDNNGVQDLGEPGIEGVTVTLCAPGDDAIFGTADDIAVAQVQTDENGRYLFGSLSFGSWRVNVTPSAGMTPTSDDDGVVTPNQSTMSVDALTPANLDQDFGYRAISPGTVGNYVWVDSNTDGISDPDGADNVAGTDDDEPAIAGVTLDIYRDVDADCLAGPGDVLLGTATTGAAGDYLFTGLPVDDGGGNARYIVRASDRAGVLHGYWHSLGAANTNNHSQTDPWCAELTAAAPADLKGAFGYFIEPASLGNYVWRDNDWSGSQSAGDTPLGGVVLTLVIDYPGGVSTTVLAQTNAAGFYSFDKLLLDEDHACATAAGPPVTQPRFTVSVTGAQAPLTGLAPTFVDRSGVDDKLDSDSHSGMQAMTCKGLTNVLVQVPATLAQTIAAYDFGYRTLKPLTWTAFLNGSAFTGGDAQPGANPDGDIYPNILEYAFCLPPRSGTPLTPNGDPSFCLLQVTGGTFNAAITRPIGAAGLSYTLEYAAALGNPTDWIGDEDIIPVSVNNGNGTETVTWPDLEQIPDLANGRGFVRIMVMLDTDGDDIADFSGATYVMGWRDHRIEQQCETYSNPFMKKELFTGTADAGSPLNAINVTGSAGGANVAAVLAAGQCVFVEVISGPMEGHRFAVNAAGSNADTIALTPGSPLNTQTPIPDLSGAAFVVRSAWMFNDLFPSALFQSGVDPNSADNLLSFNPDTQQWTTYYLADTGGSGIYWVDSSDGAPLPANQNARCIDPCEGLFVHRRGAALAVPTFGVVRENDFACPLPAGYALLGGGYPMDQSYTGRGMTIANGFDGDMDLRMADQVLFWAGDTTPGHLCYQTHYLLDAGAPWLRWVSAEDNFVTPQDDMDLFKAGRAAFHCRRLGLPGFRITATWAP